MKIYTKNGDSGKTSTYGGKKLSKSESQICCLGEVDELNAYLGVILSANHSQHIRPIILNIQHHLFDLGAFIAGSDVCVELKHTVELEHIIDDFDKRLSPLKNFILPGGHLSAAHLHYARTICRRAERSLVQYFENLELTDQHQAVLSYMNRLSDLLFILARFENTYFDVEDVKWTATKG